MDPIADFFKGIDNTPPCPECQKHGRPVSLVQRYLVMNDKDGNDTINHRCLDCGHTWRVSVPTSVKQAESEGE